MPDPHRLALERALAAARETVAYLEAQLAHTEPGVPLKRAAYEMGINEEAALKRAQRGAGVKRDGAWYFSRAYVDEVRAAGKCPVKCPDASGYGEALPSA